MAEAEAKSFENPAYVLGEDPAAAGVMKATSAPAATNEVDDGNYFVLYSQFTLHVKAKDQMSNGLLCSLQVFQGHIDNPLYAQPKQSSRKPASKVCLTFTNHQFQRFAKCFDMWWVQGFMNLKIRYS